MQSSKYDEIESYRRLRDNKGVELSPESHLMPPRHDIYDGSLMRPLNLGIGSSRGDRRSGSMERRDYGWGRNEIGRSRSPRFGQVHKRINCGLSSSRDEMRRKYEFCDYMDRLDNVDTSLKCNYSDKSRFSGNTGKDIARDRALGADLKHDYSGNKSMVQEDGTGQGRHRLSGDVRPSNYHEHSENFGPSMNADLGRFKDGGVKYPDSVLLDKISAIERYEKLSSRDVSHFKDLTFPSKGFSDRSQFKEFGSMSAGLSGNFLDSHKEGMSVSTDMYRGSSTKALEPFSLNEYGHRRSSETRRAPEPGHKDLMGYQWDTFRPNKEDEDDLYAKPRQREDKFCDYASEELNTRRLLYERDSYDPRDMLTQKESIRQHIDDHEHSPRNVDRSLQDLSSYQSHFASESLDDSRLPCTSEHGGRYLETRRAPEPGHKDLMGYQWDTFCPNKEDEDDLYAKPRQREDKFCDYASEELNTRRLLYERDSYDPRDMLTQKESIRQHIDDHEHSPRNVDRSLQDLSSYQSHFASESLDDSRLPCTSKHGGRHLDCGSPGVAFEMDALREPELSSLGVSHDNDILRTKYDFKCIAGWPIRERMRNSSDCHHTSERHDFKIMVSSELNWNKLDRTHDLTDRDERCNEYADDLSFSKTLEFENGRCSRAGKRTFGAESGRISAPEDWSTPYESAKHVEEYSIKSGRKKPKVHVGPGLLNLYSSQRSDKKHYLLKNVWVRGRDDVKVDMHATDVEGTENLSGSAKSEPPENSEEFKQIVHWFFLSFTKKINMSPSAHKRYKEQGKAGSLFCIVCSRSQSKEFTDTQSLLAHCSMSHKFGLRAQHLGLHRAICVLMGWDSKTASSVPTVVSNSEALAQKDDLILWPPVVIVHNTCKFRRSSAGKEVINLEAFEDFLRGKGFSGGQMKVCLGNPGNTIIMVVKFLGTVTGLQDAEKLKKYFEENKRGRADFEKLASVKGKSRNGHEAGTKAGKLDELFLYGYMGIAEDLDKVDFDTKRRCSVRSYKEIQDIANDPVKFDQS
ncbi:unnamed protein product [Fraxinus pennsylvanica]|uniref:XS domain-containing protein n=1 Tax=Fraxinus pennsylvanica TaxID=56036 RepID=A0AAD1YYM7_9LAMI|nr:unnamed protein product [Fraxinus pennsylvanica]